MKTRQENFSTQCYYEFSSQTVFTITFDFKIKYKIFSEKNAQTISYNDTQLSSSVMKNEQEHK